MIVNAFTCNERRVPGKYSFIILTEKVKRKNSVDLLPDKITVVTSGTPGLLRFCRYIYFPPLTHKKVF